MILSQSTAEIIAADVKRSYTNTKGIQTSNLANILNTYAVVNPELDYCQGMNFIAGFLFLSVKEESLAFAVMREIIQKF